MKRMAFCLAFAVTIDATAIMAQTLVGTGIERLDPALDQIVPSSATVEVLKNDYFGIAEGPIWIQRGQSGYLLFSDIAANVIYKWTPDHMLSVFLERSGYNSTDLGPVGQQGYVAFNGRMYVSTFGSNGIVVDDQGRIVFCAQGDRAIVRLETDETRTVLANKFEGRPLGRPNDLVMRSDGTVYFTVRAMAVASGEFLGGVYRVKNGQVQLVEEDKGLPNGIGLSPDEKTLYVSHMSERRLIKYDVLANGSTTNPRVFVNMNEDKAPGGPDGMKVDSKGNVFSTGPGGVWVISSEGRHIGTIKLSQNATNLAFGDADYKTLYITHQRHLARIRLNTEGIRPTVRP